MDHKRTVLHAVGGGGGGGDTLTMASCTSYHVLPLVAAAPWLRLAFLLYTTALSFGGVRDMLPPIMAFEHGKMAGSHQMVTFTIPLSTPLKRPLISKVGQSLHSRGVFSV